MIWRVGMKAVFVGYPTASGTFRGNRRINVKEWLAVGDVRTILEIAERDRYAKSRWAGPSLYVGCDHPKYGQVWHHCSGFRPLVTRSTDISIFTAMLHDDRVPEPA